MSNLFSTFFKFPNNDLLRKDKCQVGADPSLTGASTWLRWKSELKELNLELMPLDHNPVDVVWKPEDRPARPDKPVEVHDLKYAGKLSTECFTDLGKLNLMMVVRF